MTADAQPLAEEDAKLVTLARGARARIAAAQGAAIRDELGRTYAGASVSSEHLSLSALELAVASAMAAGARGVEAAVIVQAGTDEVEGMPALRDLGGAGVPVYACGPDGVVAAVHRT